MSYTVISLCGLKLHFPHFFRFHFRQKHMFKAESAFRYYRRRSDTVSIIVYMCIFASACYKVFLKIHSTIFEKQTEICCFCSWIFLIESLLYFIFLNSLQSCVYTPGCSKQDKVIVSPPRPKFSFLIMQHLICSKAVVSRPESLLKYCYILWCPG